MAQSRINRPVRLVGQVAQGGADAFAIATLQTGLSGLGTRALSLSFLQIEINGVVPNVNSASLEVCLSRATKAAMPRITDRDVIAKYVRAMSFTTSGAAYQPLVDTLVPAAELIVVEDPLYMIIDGTNTAASFTAYFALEFNEISITETDRLSIVAQRLGG